MATEEESYGIRANVTIRNFLSGGLPLFRQIMFRLIAVFRHPNEPHTAPREHPSVERNSN
jgi:hypothetical protein